MFHGQIEKHSKSGIAGTATSATNKCLGCIQNSIFAFVLTTLGLLCTVMHVRGTHDYGIRWWNVFAVDIITGTQLSAHYNEV